MVVAGSGETTVDLIRDMMHVLTSCCARLHDRRVARNRARSAVTCASSRLVPVLPAASRNAETDGGLRRFVIPEGWVARGCRFEVEPTTRHQRSAIGQHFGARRFAYNWALARVKANLDARTPTRRSPHWRGVFPPSTATGTRPSTRSPRGGAVLQGGLRLWDCRSGRGLTQLADSKHGRRRWGRRVGFPRFKIRRRDRGRIRFTTGAMRLEADRRHLVAPVIGRLRSKENTRRLARLIAKGRARILSITLTEHGGRLFVSITTIVAQAPRIPSQPGPMDLVAPVIRKFRALELMPEEVLPTMAGALTAAALGQSPLRWRRTIGAITLITEDGEGPPGPTPYGCWPTSSTLRRTSMAQRPSSLTASSPGCRR